MRLNNYLTGIEGVAAGNIATINAVVNRRYHSIELAYTESGVLTDVTTGIDYIRLIVNGVVIRDLTPAQYLGIAKMNGITPATGYIPIYFSEPWRASVIGEEATSWDLFGQRTFTIEIGINSGATAPAVVALASYDFSRNVSGEQPFLSIVKQLRYSYNAPAGTFDMTTLPIVYPIQRIELVAASGVTSVEVQRDSEKIYEATVSRNVELLKAHGMTDPAEFAFPIVFDYSQQISDALVVDRDLVVRVVSGGAQTITAIVEQRANGFV